MYPLYSLKSLSVHWLCPPMSIGAGNLRGALVMQREVTRYGETMRLQCGPKSVLATRGCTHSAVGCYSGLSINALAMRPEQLLAAR